MNKNNFMIPRQNQQILQYFSRVFLIFLVAIGVPSFILTTYFFINMMKQEQKLNTSYYSSQFDFQVSNTTNFLTQCNSLVYQVQDSTYLSQTQNKEYKDVVYAYRTFSKMLVTFTNSTSFDIDASMYIQNGNRVLSTTNQIYTLENYENTNLITDFLTAGVSSAFTEIGDNFVFITTLPTYYYDDSIVFLFFIDIESLLQTTECFIQIPNGDILFHKEYTENVDLIYDDAMHHYKTDNATVWYTNVPGTGIIIGNIFDSSTILSDSISFILFTFITILLSALFICIIAYIAACYQSRSIMALSSQIDSLSQFASYENDKPIFESIANLVFDLHKQNETYAQTISKNKNAVKEQALRRLVYNQVPNTPAFASFFPDNNIEYNGSTIVLSLLSIDKNFLSKSDISITNINILIREFLTEYFANSPLFMGTVILGTDAIGVLINNDATIEDEFFVDTTIKKTISAIEQQVEMRIDATIGYPVDNSNKLYESYLLMREQLDKPKRKLVKIKDSSTDTLCFSPTIHTDLLNALLLKDIGTINNLLQTMLESEKSSKISTSSTLCFAIICNLLGNFYESWFDSSVYSQEIYQAFAPERTMEERYQLLAQIFEKILTTNNDNADNAEYNNYILVAKKYMQDNLSEDFSIPALSEKLNISTPYFNRIFKTHTGLTPLQFITNLRINKSKDLLINTTIPVKEIASQVGYPECRNYVRYFKKNEGLTPSDYREKFNKS